MLSDGSKSAYEALIDNGPRNICSTSSSKATVSHSNPSSPRSPPANLDQQVLLPALPPKSDTVKMTVEKKRHVRKNPLVMHQSEGLPQVWPLGQFYSVFFCKNKSLVVCVDPRIWQGNVPTKDSLVLVSDPSRFPQPNLVCVSRTTRCVMQGADGPMIPSKTIDLD